MSAKHEADEDDGDGCLPLFAVLCISIAVGHIYTEAHGWLTLGCLLLFIWLRSSK